VLRRSVVTAAMLFPLVTIIRSPLAGQTHPPTFENPGVHDIVSRISTAQIRGYITRLVGFGTRHSFSDTLSETRGIGAARRWIKSEFDRISEACDGCLEVFYLQEVFPPVRRIPDSMNVVSVVAIQRGATDPNRMIVMSGDIDAIISGGTGWENTDSVPGANDNASGMAGTLEAARVLSQYRFNGSIVYMGLSGEEQGLLGGQTVARHAREHGWNIIGVLNNDMIGNTQGISGVTENLTARVFSDPTPMSPEIREMVNQSIETVRELAGQGPSVEFDQALAGLRRLTELQWSMLRSGGGEVDGSSRQLARYVDRIADVYFPNLDIMMIYRLDRFGRGGHHRPFADAGYPAVRIMETNENYNRQHQTIRDEGGIHYGDVLESVDFAYATKLTALNAATLASLAAAPGPPVNVRLSGANSPAASLEWDPPLDEQNVTGYRVHWRRTDSPTWDNAEWLGNITAHRFTGLVVDNYYFGVSAVAFDGSESTVVFPLPTLRR